MNITILRGAAASKDSGMFTKRLLVGSAASLSQCLEERLDSSEYPNMYFQRRKRRGEDGSEGRRREGRVEWRGESH